MTNGGDKCPHCGAMEWWLDRRIPDKNFKYVYKISYCAKCHWQFVVKAKLHRVTEHGKFIEDKNKKLTNWQLFSRDCMAHGKTLKEASQLYWHEWQTNHKWPTSLTSITSSGEGNEQ